MPIFKYAKVLVLAPAIGSAAIGIVGLLVFGGILIGGHSQFANRMPERAVQNASLSALISQSLPAQSPHSPAPEASADARKIQPEAVASHPAAAKLSPANLLLQSSLKEQPIGNSPREQTKTPLNFKSSIAGDQLTFLKDSAGRVPDDANAKQQVRALVSMAAPYTPYHFGMDLPLPQVLNTLLLNEPQPIEIRDGRYATISGTRIAIHNRSGLLWVDMQQGLALGAIYFDPSNGEPSPTLTIFSRQLDGRTVKMSQLPLAFQEDLSRWAATEGVPPILTRYFIGASGDKYVLKHEENFCEPSETVAVPSPKRVCGEMNAQAALIDMTATRFMEQTHNASNATARTIASTSPVN